MLPGMVPIVTQSGLRIVRQAMVAITTDLSTYTFTAADIGPAAANRTVIVTVHASGGTGRANNSISIGGNAATRSGRITAATEMALFGSLAVASGTTADIAVAWSGGVFGRCAIRVVSVYGLQSSTPVGTDNTRNTGTSSSSCTLTTTAGGIALAAVTNNNNNRQTFTGVNEEYDTDLESGNCGVSGGLLMPTAGGSLGITSTSVSDDRTMSVVSFR